MYPSEYAYQDDSVNRAESASANCRRYLSGFNHPERFIHCGGTRLKLTDSNFGQEQYSSSEYYRWPAGSDGKLLFIFPTRVSLTAITLHYYSHNLQGLPRLRFYAVADDFNIWDAITIGTPLVDVTAVSPGGEPAGRRSISIDTMFNTKKVLMYKFSSSYYFALSEVEFFHCICKLHACMIIQCLETIATIITGTTTCSTVGATTAIVFTESILC